MLHSSFRFGYRERLHVKVTVLFLVICRLKIFSEESVPLFGPPLPPPPVFTDHQEFRDFLLVKCEEKNDWGGGGLLLVFYCFFSDLLQ